MFAAHRLDAVDDAEKAGLEGFGLPGRAAWSVRGKQPTEWCCDSLYQGLAGFLADLLDLLARPPWAHGAGVVLVVLLFLLAQLDLRAVARDDDGAGRLAAAQLWAGQVCGLAGLVDRRRRRGRAHVLVVDDGRGAVGVIGGWGNGRSGSGVGLLGRRHDAAAMVGVVGGEEWAWRAMVALPRWEQQRRWVGKVRSRYEVAASAAVRREGRAGYQAPAR